MERQHFVEKYIKDINADDGNVSITGLIIEKQDNFLVIDDGTGKIVVSIEGSTLDTDYVRVFGRVVGNEDLQIYSYFFQDMGKIDKDLYKKVKDLLV